MLGSLRARLIVSFALVVALAVFLAGAGALFLLRDQQQASAQERFGRFADPLNLSLAGLLNANTKVEDVKTFMRDRADQYGFRILLIDRDLQVIFDSDHDRLDSKYVLSFENPGIRVSITNGARYKWANYNAGDTHLTLFAPPTAGRDQPPAAYTALVAIPASALSAAWLDLAPRLALAGLIALTVSFLVSYFISRSISRPLRRITQASVQMAKGNYDVHIPIRGEDEVGRLAEAFNQMAAEVSKSQRMMKDLLANVSHELKTPLTSIQGFSEALLDGAIKSDEEFRESGRIINEEATRMRALVDDLLLLSQIESGEMSMQHTHVDLAALLERTLERFQWAIRDAGIQSGISVERVPPVHGDERRLEQVFSNLVENAVRHTPPGGVITVSAATARNGDVSVSVHNTGSVIPPEDLPRVFERFFQVDRARARKGGSSGLGLAIVAEIVEAHGGKVRAVSNDARGTEFIVTLPPATVPSEPRRTRSSAAETTKPRRTPKNREAPV